MTPVPACCFSLVLANKLPGTVCSAQTIVFTVSIDYTGILFKNSEHTFISFYNFMYLPVLNFYVPNHFSYDSCIVYGVETILGCPIHNFFYRSSADCGSGLIVLEGTNFFSLPVLFPDKIQLLPVHVYGVQDPRLPQTQLTIRLH